VTTFNVALEAAQKNFCSLFSYGRERERVMPCALTAASIFAGDSSFGLESIEMMLRTILSTCIYESTIN
jgi:hypothetical protein